ncbi:MAG: coiled-coil domain-containing protein [Candidatus Anammoxibacter sp.]
MPDVTNSVIEGVKSFLLPELRKLHEGQSAIRIRQDSIEKQLAIMNENILDNSRRIDGTNTRIDETNKRIDETNKRIDYVYVELGNIQQQMERLNREEVITGDILHRMEVLEGKVLLGK